MQGNIDGSQVWFNPVGLHVEPGQTIRWLNLDPGNSHTVTAYHPNNFERLLRIPEGAGPWNSDYLLPNESFSVTLSVEGVYDFYCIPHEHASMVGRIICGQPGRFPNDHPLPQAAGGEPIPEIALQAFPAVDEIMRRGGQALTSARKDDGPAVSGSRRPCWSVSACRSLRKDDDVSLQKVDSTSMRSLDAAGLLPCQHVAAKDVTTLRPRKSSLVKDVGFTR